MDKIDKRVTTFIDSSKDRYHNYFEVLIFTESDSSGFELTIRFGNFVFWGYLAKLQPIRIVANFKDTFWLCQDVSIP